MKKILLGLFLSFVVSSCCKKYLTVQTDYLTNKDLASYYVGTPDPRQNCPTVGQRLIVSWVVPKNYLCYTNLRLEVTMRFRNREEHKEIFPISKTRGTYVYTLLNDDYFSSRGILTYKVDLIGGETIFEEWRHRIWIDLIQVGQEAPEEKVGEDNSSDCKDEQTSDEYPIDWNDEPL